MTREDTDRILLEELKAAHNNVMTVMENHIMSIAGCDRRTANMIANEVLDLDRGADNLLETPTENKRKVKVYVEEHLCRCIEVEIIPTVSEAEEMEYAEEIVRRLISDKDIILTADDWNGVRLYCVEDKDGHSTDWHE